MAEPVTIGGQTFIKTNDGWVDQKTKSKAPDGLLSLLNRLQVENSPEGKKKRVRIDTSRPVVKLGKTEYVWDLNSGVWIDKKTKDAANPAFSKLIEAAYQSILQGVTDEEKLYESWAKTAAAGQVFAGMGAVGQAGKQKVKTPTGGGQLPAPNIKINSPIVQMIEKLATIDGYLKQRLDNQKKIAANNNAMAREASIESSGQLDAAPVIDEEKIKQEAEKENEKSNGAILAVAAIAAASLVSQLEPVKEAFSSVLDFAKGIYGYFKDFTNVTNNALESINSMFGESSPNKETNKNGSAVASASTPNASEASSVSPTSSATPAASSSSASSAAAAIVPQTAAPSTGTPAPVAASNSRSTSPTTPSNSGSPRVNTTPSAPNNSGSRSSAPSPTRSNVTPSSSPSPSNAAPVQSSPAPAAPATKPNATPAQPQTADATQQTGQDSRKPSDILQFTARTGSEANFRGLPTQFQKALLDAGTEYKQKTGQKLIITSARRSPDEQQRLLDEKAAGRSPNSGGVVAGKYSSPHVKGTGVDIAQAGAAANILGKYGIIWQAIPGDEVHYNYKGPGAATDSIWGSDTSGSQQGVFGKLVSTGVDIGKGAIEAIGIIAQAAFGKQTAMSGSQLLGFNDTMVGNINKAAREKTSAMIDSKNPEAAATSIPAPISLNTVSSSSSMQGIKSTSDKASIQWYLTRMGFTEVNYEQTSHA